MLDTLTIILFLVAIIAGLGGFKLGQGFGYILRPGFALITFLAAWSVLVTVFWLAGVELKVGTIQDGKMAENWWLPIATTGYAALVYGVGVWNKRNRLKSPVKQKHSRQKANK